MPYWPIVIGQKQPRDKSYICFVKYSRTTIFPNICCPLTPKGNDVELSLEKCLLRSHSLCTDLSLIELDIELEIDTQCGALYRDDVRV